MVTRRQRQQLNYLLDILNTNNLSNLFKINYNSEILTIINILVDAGFLIIHTLHKEDKYVIVKKKSPWINFRPISKPGRRVYFKAFKCEHMLKTPTLLRGCPCVFLSFSRGLGEYIVRTSEGIMLYRQAYKLHLGGEILFSVGFSVLDHPFVPQR